MTSGSEERGRERRSAAAAWAWVALCTTACSSGPSPATRSPPDPAPAPGRALDWTLGTWRGVRRDGKSGSPAQMTLRNDPILGGAGQVRELEVETADGRYRGFAVQVFDPDAGRWSRRYVNDVRRRFARLTREVAGSTSIWRSHPGPGRRRSSRLVSERVGPDRWRRTMNVSEDGGRSWRVLWVDVLRRSPSAPRRR